MCGWAAAPHWGHVVRVVGAAFQFARRERVLDRDIFRFGTATSVPLLLRVVLQQSAEGRPSGVDHFMMVVRVLGEVQTALGAQPRAVVPTHGLERQGGNHRVPQHGLEVDEVVHQLVHVVLVRVTRHLVVVRRPIGVGVQLLDSRV